MFLVVYLNLPVLWNVLSKSPYPQLPQMLYLPSCGHTCQPPPFSPHRTQFILLGCFVERFLVGLDRTSMTWCCIYQKKFYFKHGLNQKNESLVTGGIGKVFSVGDRQFLLIHGAWLMGLVLSYVGYAELKTASFWQGIC